MDINRLPGAVWPMMARPTAGATVQYQAGHATIAAIPSAYKLAIMQLAAHWYENRELASLDPSQRVPMQAERIISKFRLVRL